MRLRRMASILTVTSVEEVSKRYMFRYEVSYSLVILFESLWLGLALSPLVAGSFVVTLSQHDQVASDAQVDYIWAAYWLLLAFGLVQFVAIINLVCAKALKHPYLLLPFMGWRLITAILAVCTLINIALTKGQSTSVSVHDGPLNGTAMATVKSVEISAAAVTSVRISLGVVLGVFAILGIWSIGALIGHFRVWKQERKKAAERAAMPGWHVGLFDKIIYQIPESLDQKIISDPTSTDTVHP